MKILLPIYCFLLLPPLAFSQKDSVTVYVFLREDCVISQNYTPKLNQLFEQYHSAELGFVGIFPSTRDAQITAFQKKYQLAFPLQSDYYQTTTKKLSATVTPEVVIYNHACGEILYQGRIDNTYFRVGKKRTITTTSDLEDALKAIKNNHPVALKKTEPVGCLITFN